ncbi:hypothetical protein B0H13DRAFT_2387661 [Mycena leptocephala]|nr:hypothetical protein B0H13DRAFT_2387661 [Mycena leptocephala]
MLFKIEVENDEVKCEETEEAAPLISQIDADDIELAHCDLCRIPLGPQADSADSWAFRCFNCELSVQCETCCSQTHLASDSHVLQEWSNVVREWGENIGICELMPTMAKICGVCEMELAARNAMLQHGTFMCCDCGPKLMCKRCCMAEHKMQPLHRVKLWEHGWQATTLAEEGLVYNLGHQGKPCLWPVHPPIAMTVISKAGAQTVNMMKCGCGIYEAGVAGEWAQIKAIGWFRAGLIHSRVCATFRVLSRECEAEYEPGSGGLAGDHSNWLAAAGVESSRDLRGVLGAEWWL